MFVNVFICSLSSLIRASGNRVVAVSQCLWSLYMRFLSASQRKT